MNAIAVISHEAFAHNVRTLAARVAPAGVMLAVKANAYGHGMQRLAPIALANGADSLAVLEIPAALALREAGIDCRIFAWLHGARSDFESAVSAAVDLGVSGLRELEAVAAAARKTKEVGLVHLKIDTGLHRNGALAEEWPVLVSRARDLAADGTIRIVGIWSHLADASPEDDEAALRKFRTALSEAESLGVSPDLHHIAASSAGWREPTARFDLVRFGIAAYGISPFDDLSGSELGLRAVMTLETTVSPDSAPAGHIWVAAGWQDGVPIASTGASMMVGHTLMDVVDVQVDRTLLGGVSLSEPGSQRVLAGSAVTVFGDPETGAPSAEDWARWSGTIGDEIVTGVPASVDRYHYAAAERYRPGIRSHDSD
jgi:alanine racemase